MTHPAASQSPVRSVEAPPGTDPEIARRFTLAEQVVSLPGLEIPLLKPRNSDDLISEADYVMDERLPYWADLWTAAEVLAEYVLEHGPELLQRLRDGSAAGTANADTESSPVSALELGCGLGLVSIVAEQVGFEALATDYYEDALLFVRENARRVLGREIATRLVDWTALPADLERANLVIAADVLYEMRYAEVVANAVDRSLAEGGVFLLSDQGRIALGAFQEAMTQRGFSGRILHRVPAPPGVAKPSITIYEFRKRSS